MAGDTVPFRLRRRYLPDVRFMAVLACQIHLQVDIMLAGIRDVGMAFYRTVRPIRPCLDVRVVTLIAVELHGSIGRDLYLYRFLYGFLLRLEMPDVDGSVSEQFLSHRFTPMAEETFLPARHQVLGAIGVAIETGERPHGQTRFCALGVLGLCHCIMRPKFLVLMAGQTIPLLHGEFMRPVTVALGAFNLLVEDMLCMIARLADVRGSRIFLILFPVASEAEGPRHDNLSVARVDRSLAEEGKAVHLDDLVFL